MIHPNLAEIYRQRVEHLHEALHDGTTRDEAFELIRSLIDEICLVPEDGQLRVELRGELAEILALAADSGKPGSLSGQHAVSTAGWLYLGGLRGGPCPAALSSAMIWRRLSIPSRVKAGTPSSPTP